MITIRLCVFAAVVSLTTAQYYIPAQILIPTLNGTHVLVSNGSIPLNNTAGVVHRPPSTLYNTNGNKVVVGNAYNSSNSTNSTRDGHLIVGTIQTFDRLLFNQKYFKDRRWWASREKIIEYPKAGYARHETIHAIRIYNKFYDGNSARAYIVKGGVGRQYVKIRLDSKLNHGFRFLVQIYGH